MPTPQLQNGTILLAEPFMLDPNFRRAAVLVVENNPEGSIGFIMNRTVDMRIDELVADFPEFDAPVYFGGPVGTDTVHYLHRLGNLIEDSDEVVKGIYWGGNYKQLKALIREGMVQPADIRFFVGYSGWSEQQLEEELQIGSWVTAPMFANYLFKSKPERLWRQVMQNKGRHYRVIADMAEEPNYN